MSAQPPPAPVFARLPDRLRALWPAPMAIDRRERWRIVAGVALGLLVAGALSWAALRLVGASLWLMPPLGASAVLVFGLPASPLAQPWSVVAGNTVSALVGVVCTWLAGAALSGLFSTFGIAMPVLPGAGPAGAVLLAPLAAATAVGAMIMLRCLHPPGGAVAVLVVLGGIVDPAFALFPVAVNSLLLVLAGAVYNPLTGRRYPHAAAAAPATAAAAPARPAIDEADVDAALARYNQLVDLPRDDLRHLLEDAQLHAQARRLQGIRCADVMTPDPLTVSLDTPQSQAWALLRRERIKALPVVDRSRHLVGIVTQSDFLRAAGADDPALFGEGLGRRLQPGRSDRVSRIMTRKVRVSRIDRSLADLLPIFSGTSHHHIPSVDEAQRLVGIVTQTDLVRALAERAAPDSR